MNGKSDYMYLLSVLITHHNSRLCLIGVLSEKTNLYNTSSNFSVQ